MANGKPGRPTKYNAEIANRLLTLVSEGCTWTKACRAVDINEDTLWRWIDKQPGFSDRYHEARSRQLDRWASDIVDIASDTSRDVLVAKETIEGPNGTTVKYRETSDNTATQRDKLIVDTKRWLLSKLRPEQYGDKLQTQLSGSIEVIPQINYTNKAPAVAASSKPPALDCLTAGQPAKPDPE
jgi:hypothetical protein